MNKQETALHIGEIFMAKEEGKEIICSDGAQAGTVGCLSRIDVVQHPERYSIKKEPQLIYENVYRHIEDEDEDEVRFYTYTYSKKASALKAAEEFPDRLVLAAHPIELPEVT